MNEYERAREQILGLMLDAIGEAREYPMNQLPNELQTKSSPK